MSRRSLPERGSFDPIPGAEESVECRLVADDPHNDAPSSAHHTAGNQDDAIDEAPELHANGSGMGIPSLASIPILASSAQPQYDAQ